MTNSPLKTQTSEAKTLMEVLIRFCLLGFIFFLCARVFAPFTGVMLWALIMAVALYPLHQKLAKSLGGKQGRASTLMVLLLFVGFGVPTFYLSNSLLGQVQEVSAAIEAQTFKIEAPADSVKEWPVVGEKVYMAWDAASTNLPAFVESNHALLVKYSKGALAMALGGAKSLFLLMAAFILATVMMAFSESGIAGMAKIFKRVCGPEKAAGMQTLCTATVRSVAVGVIGVALIQSLLFGVGFVFAGIPAAAILTLVVLVMGIVQLPGVLVAIPAIAYLWGVGDASMPVNVILSIYFVVASLADNVLKPMLLGRGVDAPMPVILIGALGGMISSGFIGLFLGAVLLAVGYQVFMHWVDEDFEDVEAVPLDPSSDA